MSDALLRFSERWHGGYHDIERIRPESLDMVEAELSIRLPLDYRQQVIEVGLPSMGLDLLEAVSDAGMFAPPDVDQFLKPDEIIETTEDWRDIGLPDTLVAIASDSMGNLFCFATGDMQHAQPTAPIYFWDHDFDDTSFVANSFSVWLERYLSL